jgi:tetratricopeptide (TPR) repeat protein
MLVSIDPQPLKAPQDLIRFYQGGEARLVQAELGPARDAFEKALNAYRKTSDRAGTAGCLLKLGRVLELLGEYDGAQETYQESLNFYIQLNDQLNTARSKAFLGNVAWAKGDYENAWKFFQEAQLYFKVAGDEQSLAWVNALMGNLYLAEGKDMEAENSYRAAFVVVQRTGESQDGEAWSDYHRAALELFRYHIPQAQEGFLAALKIFTRLKDVLGQVSTLVHLSEIAGDQKKWDEAEKYIIEALKLVIPTQCKPLLADTMTGLARVLKGQGEEQKAIGILMFALSHPTCRQQTKDRMITMLKSWKAHFSEQENESGFKWAKDFTIEEMAAAWLKAFLAKPKTRKTKA